MFSSLASDLCFQISFAQQNQNLKQREIIEKKIDM